MLVFPFFAWYDTKDVELLSAQIILWRENMKKNRLFITAVLAAITALAAAGCGQRADTPPATEAATKAVETEAVTEAPVEAVVVSQTELPTEAVTEEQTEAPTEAPTETEKIWPENLTSDEEEQNESELAEEKIFFAKDDINVRTTPDTENSDNIISSYDQGARVTVVGETPNWYVVRQEDWTGYVYKANLSETAVDEKTPEERSEAADQEAVAQAEALGTVEETVDYADTFQVRVTSDANIRANASNQANIIGVLNAGDVVTALGESDNWFQVEADGVVGYVNSTLIE